MFKKWSTRVLFALALFVVVAILTTLVVENAGAKAEDSPEKWYSSMAPPEGTPLDALSPPDIPGLDPNRIDGEPEPRAAIKDFRIAGSVLRPRASSVDFMWDSEGGCIYSTNQGGEVWNTPIWLPQGSEIIVVRMYYDDTSTSNSVGWLTIYDLYGEVSEEWNVGSSGDFGKGFNDTGEISHEIDYLSYAYVLNWRPVVASSAMQLCGFRIFYEPPPFSVHFVPYITRN